MQYRICSNIGLVLYLTQAHRGPGLYWKEANIRDMPLFRFEENGLPVECFVFTESQASARVKSSSYRSYGLDSLADIAPLWYCHVTITSIMLRPAQKIASQSINLTT